MKKVKLVISNMENKDTTLIYNVGDSEAELLERVLGDIKSIKKKRNMGFEVVDNE